MKRRRFLETLPATYSLVVLADRIPPAPAAPPARAARDFDVLAPGSARPARAGYEPNLTPVDLETDLLVAGGGLAGVCAAVAAARHGVKVVLVQDRSRLGGNSSSEVKMHVVGANSHKARPGWREGGLIEEFRLDDAVNNPQRCWELWDLLLYDKVVSEPNITLLLETTLFAAKKKAGRIEQVLARCDKSEHLYRIRAKYFLDATGDSRLALEAGADYRTGREGRAEFGESLAPEKPDGQTQGSSILFTSRIYPRPMPFRPPKWARKVTAEHLRHRKITTWEYGYWWIEWGGHLNTIRDNERIRYELLSIVMGVWDYIKNSGDFPDSANFALDWVGMMPGKRESRRVLGDYLLKQQDLERGDIEDAVCIGGWPMDDHPPGGFDRADLPPYQSIRLPEPYGIPLRCFYSRNVRNLFMAGRNISCTHVAFSSTRVMATCAVGGQAAGTAAAYCIEHGIPPRALFEDKKHFKELEQALLRDDQTIRGRRNEDPRDLARTARVTASSEHGGGKAALVIDGFVRDIPGGKPGIHHWEAPLEAGGAWLELAWDRPQKIGHIQLTFDTGFQRELTLTSSDAIHRGIIRAAQPETVRDYVITGRSGGRDLQLAAVEGNHQRINRHRFEPAELDAVRIHVKATNGDPVARIFEVRCYSGSLAGA